MFASGTRLGPYRVDTLIGEGGMGQVYRGTDTRLDRTVAIKVLPSKLSSHPHLRDRFEREARAISSLTHPHICTLFDVGRDDGIDYLVMEYLEGESLADRLARGALPVEQVLRYGAEIADALASAHRRGIVHRDLKPGNVMLTKSGAKLLDFGLAKTATTVPAPDAETEVQKPLTADGAILGTFPYMAPEQLEGREADVRTDVFALGAVLYEMVTGKRAFEGKTKASLIASILDRDPAPISSVEQTAPVALDRLIRACLAKDPDERLQSARDVAMELRWIAGDAGEQRPPRRLRRAWPFAAVAISLLLLAASVVVTWKRETAPSRAVHLAFMASPGFGMIRAAISRQGTPKTLFRFPAHASIRWELSADGKRILVNELADTASATLAYNVVIGWKEMLER